LIVIDHVSALCNAGPENDAASWLAVQEWALRMRSRGFSILFVHHSGKGGQQRGTSRREDVLDTVICLRHPAGYSPDEGACFEVHYEKNRGFYGADAKPFEARLLTNGDTQEWALRDIEESTAHKVANLLNEGVAQKDIHELLGVSKGTVSKAKKKAHHLRLIDGGRDD
jgi:putative DNA primase/helicase